METKELINDLITRLEYKKIQINNQRREYLLRDNFLMVAQKDGNLASLEKALDALADIGFNIDFE